MDVITLKHGERQELNQWVRGQSRDAAQARRARLILMLADSERYGLIRDKLDCDTNFIARWKSRFLAEGLAGLYSRHGGKSPGPGSGRQEARILRWTTQKKPTDGSTHWSSRKLSLELGDVSHMTIARVWSKHGIKPHRLERYMASNDADFESKAADIMDCI
jgi:transposase